MHEPPDVERERRQTAGMEVRPGSRCGFVTPRRYQAIVLDSFSTGAISWRDNPSLTLTWGFAVLDSPDVHELVVTELLDPITPSTIRRNVSRGARPVISSLP